MGERTDGSMVPEMAPGSWLIGTTGLTGLVSGSFATVSGPYGQHVTMTMESARQVADWLGKVTGVALEQTPEDNDEMARLRAHLAEAQEKAAGLKMELEQARAEAAGLRRELADCRSQVDGAERRGKALTAAIDFWRGTNAAASRVVDTALEFAAYVDGKSEAPALDDPKRHLSEMAQAAASDSVPRGMMGLPSSPPHVLTRTGAMRQRVSVVTALRGCRLESREAHYAVDALAAVSAVLVFLPARSAESMREDLAGLDVQIETLEAYLGRVGGAEAAPSTWQDRLVAELKEGEDRAVKLMRFICSPVDYGALPAADRALLREQYDAMNAYLGVLRRRVARFAEQA